MTNSRLLNRKLPVIYRWVRRRRYFPHAVLLCCAVLVLPIGIIGGARLSHAVSVNQAMAATRALAPEYAALDGVSAKERIAYAAALKGLVIENPQKFHQLVGHDVMVLFREPDLKRTEGETMSWQYQADGCVLDIYFGGGGASGRVVHYEVRPRRVAAFAVETDEGEAEVDTAGCLEKIYRRKAA